MLCGLMDDRIFVKSSIELNEKISQFRGLAFAGGLIGPDFY
jgi:hypothetical protein